MVSTFFSYSFGCRVNEAEKEEIDRQMLKAGFQYSSQNPLIYIINTCSVTHKAEREARQHIYQIKRKFPASKIIVTGCSATYWKKNNLVSDLPVDEIFDNLQKEYLVTLLLNRLSKQPNSNLSGLNSGKIVNKFIDSGRLLVKIQDGCQRFCSFCIVPYLRGKPKSEKIKEIVKKIYSLSSRAERSDLNHKEIASSPRVLGAPRNDNVSEVILTAINTEAFGHDTGETFIDLAQSVIDKTRVPRISFGSIHPWSINKEFFTFYQSVLPKKRLVDFFHIPLQSGSNKILTLMKRGYTREEMIEKLMSITRLNDFAFIGTDIIVGFLEENDKDYEDTYNFLKESPINKFHVFRFSKRQNTAAYYLSERLYEAPDQVKRERAKKLIELGIKKYQLFLQKHLNKDFTALFLKKRENGFQEALLSNQIPVVIKTNKDNLSEIKNVRITEYKNERLFGTIM